MPAQIVVGLGFGDEGKGLTTDFLCQQAHDSLVVRFSGGQQCGHHVCIGERRHIHSSFGSGTLRGLPSYFSQHCSFYPPTLAYEHQVLREKGCTPRLYLHPLCRLTTPFDVLANRISEQQHAHGSCGLGIGKTMQRQQAGYHLYAIDTTYPALLSQKLNLIRDYYFQTWTLSSTQLDWLSRELAQFKQALAQSLFQLADLEHLRQYPNLIFEGSQGILLDQTHGLFPHVTYAHTTSRNAIEICQSLGIDDIDIFYVTRCYSTRHGKGWMPNQHQSIALIEHDAETNQYNPYQGAFRVAELDVDALNYALSIDELYRGDARPHLMVTCLDQRPDVVWDPHVIRHPIIQTWGSYSPDAATVRLLHRNSAFCTHANGSLA